ncbi:MAG: hypothetical protein OCD03_02765 [Hyphomicrobiales bacterium]
MIYWFLGGIAFVFVFDWLVREIENKRREELLKRIVQDLALRFPNITPPTFEECKARRLAGIKKVRDGHYD